MFENKMKGTNGIQDPKHIYKSPLTKMFIKWGFSRFGCLSETGLPHTVVWNNELDL